jgi:carboxymethylenebutenolidase
MADTEAAVLAHYGETDERVNAGIASLEQAMAGKTFRRRIHPGVGHAFNNDTGAAYDEQAAVEAWTETLEWFSQHLA